MGNSLPFPSTSPKKKPKTPPFIILDRDGRCVNNKWPINKQNLNILFYFADFQRGFTEGYAHRSGDKSLTTLRFVSGWENCI